MADLAGCGYLIQPHISSGRIPSYQGYRLYINRLMNKKPIEKEDKILINGVLSQSSTDLEAILSSGAKVLSDITGCVAAVSTPSGDTSVVKDIQFVKIGRRSAMIVLTTADGMVKNKLFRCDYDINSDLLYMFHEILNGKFVGEKLENITPEFMNIMVGEDRELAFLLLPVLDVLMQAAKEARKVHVTVCGQKNLLAAPGMSPETVVNIFNFLENREELLELMSSEDYGVKFTIGSENKYLQLKNSSVVTANYNVGEKRGSIMVIGPTRMNYGEVYAQIEYIASMLGVLICRLLENN